MGKIKIPERPKRYMSAFLLFLNDFRLKNQSRGYANTEMTQKGATVWKTLTNREKQPYVDKSAKLKDKYERDYQKYQEKLKLLGKKPEDFSTSKKKSVKDKNKPKRALSAYMLFMQDFRKKNASRGWEVTEMVSKGASVWKTLTPSEKYPYETTARKNYEKYHQKLEQYKLKQKKEAVIAEMKVSSSSTKTKPATAGKQTAKRVTKTAKKADQKPQKSRAITTTTKLGATRRRKAAADLRQVKRSRKAAAGGRC